MRAVPAFQYRAAPWRVAKQVGAGLASIARALLEALFAMAVAFHVARACLEMGLPSRMSSAAWMALGPVLGLTAATLAHALLTVFRRAQPMPSDWARRNTVVMIISAGGVCAVPATIALSAQFVPLRTLVLHWDASLVTLSILGIAAAAAIEEVIYRQVLLGGMLRSGIHPLLAVLLQAIAFYWMHGPGGRVSLNSTVWYLTAGLTLGTLYVATGRLWPPILAHGLANLAIAQGAPQPGWLGIRMIESYAFPWQPAAVLALLSINGGYWLWWHLAPLFTTRPVSRDTIANSSVQPHTPH